MESNDELKDEKQEQGSSQSVDPLNKGFGKNSSITYKSSLSSVTFLTREEAESRYEEVLLSIEELEFFKSWGDDCQMTGYEQELYENLADLKFLLDL